jgi:hypothetical protein
LFAWVAQPTSNPLQPESIDILDEKEIHPFSPLLPGPAFLGTTKREFSNYEQLLNSPPPPTWAAVRPSLPDRNATNIETPSLSAQTSLRRAGNDRHAATAKPDRCRSSAYPLSQRQPRTIDGRRNSVFGRGGGSADIGVEDRMPGRKSSSSSPPPRVQRGAALRVRSRPWRPRRQAAPPSGRTMGLTARRS